MKTKIFVDFDGTVFDTGKLRSGLFEILIAAGFNEDEVTQTYQQECLDYLYSIEDHIERLEEIHKINRQNLNTRLNKLYKRCPDFVFGDANVFLRNADRTKYNLILFTMGDEKFQAKKVELSGLSRLFDRIYYTQKQKWECMGDLVSIGEKFIFIDDRGDTVKEISKQHRSAFCVEINRSNSPSDPMEPAKDFGNIIIRDFNQFATYLECESVSKRSNNAGITRS